MSIEKLKEKLKEVKDKLDKLSKLATPLHNKRIRIAKEIEDYCSHDKLRHEEGGMWHEWPDYGHYPSYIECKDCGLSLSSEREEDSKLYFELLNKVKK